MVHIIQDIDSVDSFKHTATEHIAKVKSTGRPLVLMKEGRAEAVVQSAESYQQTLDELHRLEREALRAGIASMKAGRTRSATEAIEEIRRKHGIPGWRSHRMLRMT